MNRILEMSFESLTSRRANQRTGRKGNDISLKAGT